MKSLLISGCSSGIGRATALHFAGKGYRVFAGVRKEADAASLTAADGSGNLEPVMLDVTSVEQCQAVADLLAATLGPSGLDVLVNNAGVGDGAPLEFVDPEMVRHTFEVNVMGPLLLTQSLLPLIRLARGRIITVGSISGKLSGPINGPYSMSKFAVEAFCDSLRAELAPQGIQVSLIEPGPVETPMLLGVPALVETAKSTLPAEALALYGDQIRGMANYFAALGRRASSPLDAAKVIERAVESRRPKTRYLVGRDAKIGAVLKWLLPDRAFDFVNGLQMR
ncbi:MAG: SDR family NAD(P)-dependent oxidoreductase [Pseudomonadales bacterium]